MFLYTHISIYFYIFLYISIYFYIFRGALSHMFDESFYMLIFSYISRNFSMYANVSSISRNVSIYAHISIYFYIYHHLKGFDVAVYMCLFHTYLYVYMCLDKMYRLYLLFLAVNMLIFLCIPICTYMYICLSIMHRPCLEPCILIFLYTSIRIYMY